MRKINVNYDLTNYFFPMLLFLEMKIENILPFEVEMLLIEMLDAKQPRAKNWWDVGLMLGISVPMLGFVEQEESREGGSPTRCILEILSTCRNIVSLRKFVETTHALGRHDICNAIYEVYKSQGYNHGT